METERPIIMSAESVRAILDGHKSQTRRVIPARLQLCKSPEDEPEDFIRWCPYGQPGDRLWVRETWAADEGDQPFIFYRATDHESCGQPWLSPLFMPRKLSRITLEVVEIRVQQLQKITEADAIAEGITKDMYPIDGLYYASQLYAELWDSINARRGYPWDSNPWLWVVSFKMLKGETE
jgi:hypothetical protein